MKKLLFIVASMMAGIPLNAQNVSLEWAKSSGGTSDDQGNAIAVDKLGNVYACGFFEGRVDFDPGKDTFYLSSFGSGTGDIFVTKFNDTGSFIWAVKLGGTGSDRANAIALDTAGNVYLTGSFQNKADFDPGSGTSVLQALGRSDVFICKLNSSGDLVWAKKFGGTDEEEGKGIAVSIAGNIYTTGYFEDTVNYTISTSKGVLPSFGGKDIFVVRMGSSGNFDWVKHYGGTGNDAGHAIALDNSENIHTTGYFNGKASFNSGTTIAQLTSFGDADVFVSKTDAKGTYSWAKQLGGRNYECGNGIVVDGSGNVFTTGLFFGTSDFNPANTTANLTSAGDADIFISELSASGAFVTAKQIGGTKADIGFSITLDGSANIFTAGSFGDRVDFDPGTSNFNLSSSGSEDVFVVKLSSGAGFLWAKNFGGAKSDVCYAVAVNSAKNVYTSGSFVNRSDFDPGSDTFYLASNGGLDAFVHKMQTCKASTSTVVASGCYTYDYYGNTYDQSGTYTHVLTNAVGCDSIITLKLTIHTMTFNNMDTLACKSFTLNGETFTSSGVYNQMLTSKNGCDSVIVLNLTIGESFGSWSAIACNRYVYHGKTYTSGGIYTQTIQNKVGCDSTVSLKLTIKKSSDTVLNIETCDSYKLLGKIYNLSGVYVVTTNNRQDCDSTITLNLTINKSSSATLNVSECSGFTMNSQTFTKSGTYFQTIKNAAGCDSLITLNLAINNNSEVLTETACKKFVLNAQIYTSSGTYKQTLVNANGCDSLITLHLTINSANTGVTQNGAVLTANATNAVYQWLDCGRSYAPVLGQVFRDFLVKTSGNYAVKVSENSCIDTSACFNINFNSLENHQLHGVKVFPNPAKEEVFVLLQNRQDGVRLRLLSVLGQNLSEWTDLSGERFLLNLEECKTGVYFLEVSYGEKRAVVRIVKDI